MCVCVCVCAWVLRVCRTYICEYDVCVCVCVCEWVCRTYMCEYGVCVCVCVCMCASRHFSVRAVVFLRLVIVLLDGVWYVHMHSLVFARLCAG